MKRSPEVNWRQLPIPEHYEPGRVGEVWRVPYGERAEQARKWAAEHAIEAAAVDEVRVCLVLVDCQNTFCIPGFELFVAGHSGRAAVEDNVRLCHFIYRNLASIALITLTLDTHTAMQIFHPVFWVNEDGEHPVGGQTVITVAEIEAGSWRVNPRVAASIAGGDLDYLQRHVLCYTRALTAGGKYPLLVWPYHAMLGGIGHAVVSAVDEAVFFHGLARNSQPRFELKGDNPLTENYSVLRPEVLVGPDGDSIGERNRSLVDRLLQFDAVVVAGQAKSHCVAWSVHDLLCEIEERDPRLAGRVYLLDDCTSPVVVPGVVDFAEQADETFARFAEAGMHVVRSTDAMAEWPGMHLVQSRSRAR
jgi:nicotinamidase-related amidase